jgi:membrane-associated HD superfamily phosphohydrolase
LSSFSCAKQDVYQSRREAKERRIGEWAAACAAVHQARTDAAAAAAAAEQDMAVARSQQQYNRARDRLMAAQAEQQRATALKVGHAGLKCS